MVKMEVAILSISSRNEGMKSKQVCSLSSSLHGVRQVTRSVYESCDLEALYVRQWAPNQRGGEVTVWVDAGGVYYFIDSVVGGCLDGTKTKVRIWMCVLVDKKVSPSWKGFNMNMALLKRDIAEVDGIALGVVVREGKFWSKPSLKES